MPHGKKDHAMGTVREEKVRVTVMVRGKSVRRFVCRDKKATARVNLVRVKEDRVRVGRDRNARRQRAVQLVHLVPK
jgi:hypothetical protein